MAQVELRKGEYFDKMFRRFKKLVDDENVLQDARDHEYFEKPCERRKRAKAAAIKRQKRDNDNGTTKRMY